MTPATDAERAGPGPGWRRPSGRRRRSTGPGGPARPTRPPGAARLEPPRRATERGPASVTRPRAGLRRAAGPARRTRAPRGPRRVSGRAAALGAAAARR